MHEHILKALKEILHKNVVAARREGYRLYSIKIKYSYYFSLSVRDEIEIIPHGSGALQEVQHQTSIKSV